MTNNAYKSVEQIRIAEIEAGKTSYIKNRRAAESTQSKGRSFFSRDSSKESSKSITEQQKDEKK